MRYLAVALIVVTCLVCDLVAHLVDLPADQLRGWSWASTFAFIYAGIVLWREEGGLTVTSDRWAYLDPRADHDLSPAEMLDDQGVRRLLHAIKHPEEDEPPTVGEFVASTERLHERYGFPLGPRFGGVVQVPHEPCHCRTTGERCQCSAPCLDHSPFESERAEMDDWLNSIKDAGLWPAEPCPWPPPIARFWMWAVEGYVATPQALPGARHASRLFIHPGEPDPNAPRGEG